jgi:hypothetical protein
MCLRIRDKIHKTFVSQIIEVFAISSLKMSGVSNLSTFPVPFPLPFPPFFRFHFRLFSAFFPHFGNFQFFKLGLRSTIRVEPIRWPFFCLLRKFCLFAEISPFAEILPSLVPTMPIFAENSNFAEISTH